MALVYNYNDDVAAAVFISGLQVSHTFYKHLVKHDVTKMRDILSLGLKNKYRSRMLPGAKLVALPNEGIKGSKRNHSLFL